MGDGTQLGHASSLHFGQTVPDGQRWHGTPGSRPWRTLAVDPAPCSTFRRMAYAVWQLLTLLLVYLPVGIGGVIFLMVTNPSTERADGRGFRRLHQPGRSTAMPLSSPLCCISAPCSPASSL